MAPRETENNTYANFWGDKQRALWYVMIFSGVVNYIPIRVDLKIFESANKHLRIQKYPDTRGRALSSRICSNRSPSPCNTSAFNS